MHSPLPTLRICVIGATGYSGHTAACLLRAHPAVARLDAPLSARSLAEVPADTDAVVLGIPAEAAAEWAWPLVQRGVRVIDISGGHRLRDPAAHARVYGFAHPHPEALAAAVFGHGQSDAALREAQLVANPGCYAGGMLSALLPLARAGALASDGPQGRALVQVTGLSGISGAGRKATERSLYVEVAENCTPYKVQRAHQHVAEVEQDLPVHLLFTPVVVPMRQGMLISGTVAVQSSFGPEQLALIDWPDDPHWLRVDAPPEVQQVVGTPQIAVWYGLDAASRQISFVAALDNLWRGAATSAIANLNAMFGLPRELGLPLVPPPRLLHP